MKNPLIDEDFYIPASYKGKPVKYRGKISDRESFEGKEEGVYYLISTGSCYCYYDGVGMLDLQFIPNPHNPEVAGMEPCWYSEMKKSGDGWICDGCGENYSCKESLTIIKTGTLSGVAMCKECYFDNHKEEVVNEMENAKRKSTTG